MLSLKNYLPFVAAMTLVVVASNVLVQYPVFGTVGHIQLADILTWGAFTYPFSFLVTDLANRVYGPVFARKVIFTGFAIAILSSVVIPPLLLNAGLLEFAAEGSRLGRIAIASGAAFLIGQLLDVTLFNRLRAKSWWKAPAFASLLGSVADTAIFFTLAFAPVALFLGPQDDFALEFAPYMSVAATSGPRWISWAIGDLSVKLLIAAVALIPYRVLMDRFGVWRDATQPA